MHITERSIYRKKPQLTQRVIGTQYSGIVSWSANSEACRVSHLFTKVWLVWRERGKPCWEESRVKPLQRFLVADRPSLCFTSVKARRKFYSFKKRTPSSSNEIKVTIILVVSCLNKHNLVTSNTHERSLLPWFSDFHKLQSASAFTPIVVTYCVQLFFCSFLLHVIPLREANGNSEDKCDHHTYLYPYPFPWLYLVKKSWETSQE